jgi:hypothetical protein
MERKYGWFLKVVKDVGLPVTILLAIAFWLGVRVEGKFNLLERKVEIHQQFLRQICVNTAGPEWEKQRPCWEIKINYE